jgi:hypothetical protein
MLPANCCALKTRSRVAERKNKDESSLWHIEERQETRDKRQQRDRSLHLHHLRVLHHALDHGVVHQALEAT